MEAYLAHGGALEPTARNLFVHPNTVRYRLHRIADLTGRDPWHPRDLLVLQTAIILGRLAAQHPDDRVRSPAMIFWPNSPT